MYSTPLKFTVSDFYEDIPENRRILESFREENICDGYLLDNLYLLKFLSFESIANVVADKYGEIITWLEKDKTPGSLKEICRQFKVFLEIDTICTVYVPISVRLDKAAFELMLPSFKFEYRYLLDCNVPVLVSGVKYEVLAHDVFNYRPLLVIRRLLLDCIEHTGTDIHFMSSFENKKPIHRVQYRIQRELYDSDFKLDGILMQSVLNKLISLKSTTSPIDLDSLSGITTDVSNIFNDETIDLRVTGSRVSAGFYIVIAIQQITTTSQSIDELGFFPEDVKKLKYLASKNEGLILNTGKMRSGKNTTIFAILNEKVNYPIRIIEYSNPIEVRMNFPQVNYKGDIPALMSLMRLAKKEDIDYAVLNEIPNADVAFAVRDLVNSAIGVITTTHLNRVYHLPYKLSEFYGKDYKNIISQLTAVINHRMFRRQIADKLVEHRLDNPKSDFEKFAASLGVTRYYEPAEGANCKMSLQPVVEILILNEDLKTQLLNNEHLYDSEQAIKEFVQNTHETVEYKVVRGIEEGIFNIRELYQLY